MAVSQQSEVARSPTRPRGLALFASFRGYSGAFIGPDLLAGLTLAAIAIPEQMATAKLGALPPQAGFFAFIAAGVGFLVFGSNRQLSAGADSTITPIFAGALAYLAASGSPHYAALAAGLALMVGLIVGVVISLFQALTQIQEMTLVFVPKILAIFGALLLALPFMADLLHGHMMRIAARIAAE